MAALKSTWTKKMIPHDGRVIAADWAGAGILPVNGGMLMAKNDGLNLYVALDVTGVAGHDPLTNDYYWFIVDMQENRAITPNRDALFSPWLGNPNRFGWWLMAGPNATFPAAGFSRRTWTIRLDLSDLGIAFDPAGPPTVVRFGLRPVSVTPAFTEEGPADLIGDLADFGQIIMATTPAADFPGWGARARCVAARVSSFESSLGKCDLAGA